MKFEGSRMVVCEILVLTVAAIGGVLLDPVDEFANSGIDAGCVWLGTAKSKGHNAGELVTALVDNQRTSAVALAGILAARLDQASAEHNLLNLVLVAGGAALLVGDDGHAHLLQIVAGGAALLDQTPASHDSLNVRVGWGKRQYERLKLPTYSFAIKVVIDIGKTNGTHVASKWHGCLKLQQRYIVDNAVGIVVGMYCGLHHLAHNARIARGSVQLQQPHGNLIPVAVHTVSRCEDIAIVDQRAATEETRIIAALDQLGGPWIFVGAHLLAAHNAVDIRSAADCAKVSGYRGSEILLDELTSG